MYVVWQLKRKPHSDSLHHSTGWSLTWNPMDRMSNKQGLVCLHDNLKSRWHAFSWRWKMLYPGFKNICKIKWTLFSFGVQWTDLLFGEGRFPALFINGCGFLSTTWKNQVDSVYASKRLKFFEVPLCDGEDMICFFSGPSIQNTSDC